MKQIEMAIKILAAGLVAYAIIGGILLFVGEPAWKVNLFVSTSIGGVVTGAMAYLGLAKAGE